jgi:predicted pyridoxine 5'-phosphate oxidase superfamily flavin-nucleotide-binding protein
MGIDSMVRKSGAEKVIATASASGACDASPKGGRPGFVLVADPKTLYIPDYKGNALFFGMRNILENPHVGLLFMIPGVDWTFRVGGRARIVDDPPLLERLCQGDPSNRAINVAIEVTVEEAYFHCPKAYRAAKLWDGLPKEKFDDLPPNYSESAAARAQAISAR